MESDLENSEEVMKKFYEKNRQISSPSLELEEDKLKLPPATTDASPEILPNIESSKSENEILLFVVLV